MTYTDSRLSPEGMVAVGKGGIAMRYSVDAEELPADLPPMAERREATEVVEEPPTIEEVTYHWGHRPVRQTWQTDFTDTYFHRTADESATLRGWAVGSAGVIAHTTDGGKTWAPQHSGVKENLRQITFVDENHGWIAGRGVTASGQKMVDKRGRSSKRWCKTSKGSAPCSLLTRKRVGSVRIRDKHSTQQMAA